MAERETIDLKDVSLLRLHFLKKKKLHFEWNKNCKHTFGTCFSEHVAAISWTTSASGEELTYKREARGS